MFNLFKILENSMARRSNLFNSFLNSILLFEKFISIKNEKEADYYKSVLALYSNEIHEKDGNFVYWQMLIDKKEKYENSCSWRFTSWI